MNLLRHQTIWGISGGTVKPGRSDEDSYNISDIKRTAEMDEGQIWMKSLLRSSIQTEHIYKRDNIYKHLL